MDDVKRFFRRSSGKHDQNNEAPAQRRSRSATARRARQSTSPSAGIRASLYSDVPEGTAPEQGQKPYRGTASQAASSRRSISSNAPRISQTFPEDDTFQQAGVWTPSSNRDRNQRGASPGGGISNISDPSVNYSDRHDPSIPPVPRVPDSVDGRNDVAGGRRVTSGPNAPPRRLPIADEFSTTQDHLDDPPAPPPKVNNRYSNIIPRTSRKPVNDSPQSKRRSANFTNPDTVGSDESPYRKSGSLRSGASPPPPSPATGLTGAWPGRGVDRRQDEPPLPRAPSTPPQNTSTGPALPGGETPDSWRSPGSTISGRSPPPSALPEAGSQRAYTGNDPNNSYVNPSHGRGRSQASSGVEDILPRRSSSTSYMTSSATGAVMQGRQTVYKQPVLVQGAKEAPDLSQVLNVGQTVQTTQQTNMAAPVFHEVVKPIVHHVREERVEREIHYSDEHHRILPIVDVQVLPTKHYVPSGVDGTTLVEVPESVVPGRSQAKNWVVAETVSKLGVKETPHSGPRQFTARQFEDTEGDEKQYVNGEGVPTKETTWIHPPTIERGAYLSGQTLPLEMDEPPRPQSRDQAVEARKRRDKERSREPRARSQGTPQTASSSRQHPTLDPRTHDSPRQHSTLDPRMQDSPRQNSALDPRMQDSPRQNSTLDPCMQDSPPQQSAINPRMRDSSRQQQAYDPRAQRGTHNAYSNDAGLSHGGGLNSNPPRRMLDPRVEGPSMVPQQQQYQSGDMMGANGVQGNNTFDLPYRRAGAPRSDGIGGAASSPSPAAARG
ncbi:MAG: hypothetical protein M1828_000637 [Chrysothrix sp. TS-e1954]|nr:MAG: hypothetical protein M1828_000637 [Chrysothrix sp. TS-e1954]